MLMFLTLVWIFCSALSLAIFDENRTQDPVVSIKDYYSYDLPQLLAVIASQLLAPVLLLIQLFRMGADADTYYYD